MREADRDRNFWDRKAAQYDRVTTGVFGRPLPRVLELTAGSVSRAETVLEVAAGTGLMTAANAPRVRQVVATDYAENMLAVLRESLVELTPGWRGHVMFFAARDDDATVPVLASPAADVQYAGLQPFPASGQLSRWTPWRAGALVIGGHSRCDSAVAFPRPAVCRMAGTER